MIQHYLTPPNEEVSESHESSKPKRGDDNISSTSHSSIHGSELSELITALTMKAEALDNIVQPDNHSFVEHKYYNARAELLKIRKRERNRGGGGRNARRHGAGANLRST